MLTEIATVLFGLGSILFGAKQVKDGAGKIHKDYKEKKDWEKAIQPWGTQGSRNGRRKK
jgi:hypothetical protein